MVSKQTRAWKRKRRLVRIRAAAGEQQRRRDAGQDSSICPRQSGRPHVAKALRVAHRGTRSRLDRARSVPASCRIPTRSASARRLAGSAAPATPAASVGELAAARALLKRNRHEPGDRACASPREESPSHSGRTTASPRLRGSPAARTGRRPPRYSFARNWLSTSLHRAWVEVEERKPVSEAQHAVLKRLSARF